MAVRHTFVHRQGNGGHEISIKPLLAVIHFLRSIAGFENLEGHRLSG